MKNTRRIAGIVLLILLASLIQYPQATALTPQDQTISITDTHDDLFITEVGIGIDSQLCHITDPTMDIRSFLVFRELEINYWEPLENATLRFRTTATLDFDADSSVTIYGMDYSDLQVEGVLNPGWVLTVPLTSAYVNVNTSQFYGQTWHEVDVTAIVEELIRTYDWDGDGHAGTETGDAIGFVILGAEGYDTRWFIDYLYGSPSLAPQLVLHWNWEPPPPTGYEGAEFVAEYGNYTIWHVLGEGYSLEPLEYVFTYLNGGTTSFRYDTIHPLPGTSVYIGLSDEIISNAATGLPNQRNLIRMSNGTLQCVFHRKLDAVYQVYIIKSDDDGASWNGETRIDTYAGMLGQIQKNPSMAVDSQDNLYVTWAGPANGYALAQTWCNIYNISTMEWEGPVRISTYTGMNESAQYYTTSIAVDSQDDIHLAFGGSGTDLPGQIWYVNYTGSWSYPLWISNHSGSNANGNPCIVLDSNDYLYVMYIGKPFGNDPQVYVTNRTTSWAPPFKVSRGATDNEVQRTGSMAVDSQDNLHIIWSGEYGHQSKDYVWYVNWTSEGWSYPDHINDQTGDQKGPSIVIDSDDFLYVLWFGGYAGDPVYDVVLDKRDDSGWSEESIQGVGVYNSWCNARWSRWPALVVDDLIVVDENGTMVQDDLDDQEDAEDWIDQFDPDPEDPDPGGVWSEGPGEETGAFTRFRMRLWFLAMGFGCVFGPVLFFAWKRPSGYYIFCGAIVMLIGLGLLLSIGQV